MVLPAVGEVILLPFPFSDLSQAKIRPAVCIAPSGRGDWVYCQITSKSYGDPLAVKLEASDFAWGGLRHVSWAKPSRLLTVHNSVLIQSVGKLNEAGLQKVRAAIVSFLNQ